MLFASGQLGVAPDDQVPEDAEAQAVLCFENIKAILAEAGMTFADVVRFTAYVTDRAYFPVYGAVRSRYVSGNAFASTLVIVSGFTRPEFKVEVEVTAVRADCEYRHILGSRSVHATHVVFTGSSRRCDCLTLPSVRGINKNKP